METLIIVKLLCYGWGSTLPHTELIMPGFSQFNLFGCSLTCQVHFFSFCKHHLTPGTACTCGVIVLSSSLEREREILLTCSNYAKLIALNLGIMHWIDFRLCLHLHSLVFDSGLPLFDIDSILTSATGYDYKSCSNKGDSEIIYSS